MAKITKITFNLPVIEDDLLKRYCDIKGMNKTVVLREFIRSLETKLQTESTTKEH